MEMSCNFIPPTMPAMKIGVLPADFGRTRKGYFSSTRLRIIFLDGRLADDSADDSRVRPQDLG